MRTLKIVACLSFLLCLCLSASPVMADSPLTGIILEDELELKKQTETVVITQGITADATSYDLYKAKATLAKKAAAECAAISLVRRRDKCCSTFGACCSCNGCSAGLFGCDSPKDDNKVK